MYRLSFTSSSTRFVVFFSFPVWVIFRIIYFNNLYFQLNDFSMDWPSLCYDVGYFFFVLWTNVKSLVKYLTQDSSK